MNENVDPQLVLQLVANHVPPELHQNILLVGSLAAAYHYRAERANQPVRTKDADVIVQPAGAFHECIQIAQRLLDLDWRPTEKRRCRPFPFDNPMSELDVIRLHPPQTDLYFIELLGLPLPEQREPKLEVAVQLRDGYYMIPCFKFMAVLQSNQQTSSVGLQYASPALMALANLLHHPTLGTAFIADTAVLRSSKDLGRVLALAFLTPSDKLFQWHEMWWSALQHHFLNEAKDLAAQVGYGVVALLNDAAALRDAYDNATSGLLSGKNVTQDQFRVAGARLLTDVVRELHDLAGVSSR